MEEMKKYGVCIGDLRESNFCFFACKDKAEARKKANQYRKAWRNIDPITKIVLIPEEVYSSGKHREYAYTA